MDGIGVLGSFVAALDSVHISAGVCLVLAVDGIALVPACCSFESLALCGVGPSVRVVHGTSIGTGVGVRILLLCVMALVAAPACVGQLVLVIDGVGIRVGARAGVRVICGHHGAGVVVGTHVTVSTIEYRVSNHPGSSLKVGAVLLYSRQRSKKGCFWQHQQRVDEAVVGAPTEATAFEADVGIRLALPPAEHLPATAKILIHLNNQPANQLLRRAQTNQADHQPNTTY